ncbi:50S ribosomal protein L21 [bacterium]|jgi:large subunit ribosomal protein L21|nr:50S ribosomal protein L21 [bacterium]
MLAVIELGNKQYIVEEGSIFDVEKLALDPKDTITLENVLLISNDGETTVGKPTIAGAQVTATVLDQYKDKKILVFKFKNKTGYKKTQGHRQNYTTLRIDKIKTAGKSAAPTKKAVAEKSSSAESKDTKAPAKKVAPKKAPVKKATAKKASPAKSAAKKPSAAKKKEG